MEYLSPDHPIWSLWPVTILRRVCEPWHLKRSPWPVAFLHRVPDPWPSVYGVLTRDQHHPYLESWPVFLRAPSPYKESEEEKNGKSCASETRKPVPPPSPPNVSSTPSPTFISSIDEVEGDCSYVCNPSVSGECLSLSTNIAAPRKDFSRHLLQITNPMKNELCVCGYQA